MRETGWLIEIGSPGHPAWWDGRKPDTFTTDPGDVVRFARREDADRLLSWGIVKPPPGEVKITEHAWMDNNPATDAMNPIGKAEGPA